MRTYLIVLLCVNLSCAQKVKAPEKSAEETFIYKSSDFSGKNYMTCNFFADETFRGYIYHPPLKKECIHIDITESPKELLRNDDLFLQIYPFRSLKDSIEYGSSLAVHTISKFDKKKILMKSQIIDTHIVQVELGLEPDHFFLDHILEICNWDKKWQGLQLVIYERRLNQEEPVYIRTTKFLNPPFLVHPDYFREQRGVALAAYHPFLKHIPEFKSKPNRYYELAEEVCSHLQ